MPLLSKGSLQIEHTDDGTGPSVVLVHSSVSGNRQWRALIDALKDRYRVLAINLYGYGETTPWPASSAQSLYAQAHLVLTLIESLGQKVHLIGHSFGGAVAMKTALLQGQTIDKLVLLEPNPFFLLKQSGRMDAFLEARALRDHVKCFGSLGEWAKVGERFAEYWLGEGAWATMPDKRRASFLASLPPNFHEWDAVMDEETTLEQWRQLTTDTLVVSSRETRLPIREIVNLLASTNPEWSFQQIDQGGHMAPLTHPEVVNPLIRRFLDGG